MEITIKKLLMQELAKRQTRNPSYSLRAFARDLDIGSTTLSDVLGDRRSLSKTNLEKVMERLLVSPLEKELLWSEYKQGSTKVEIDERLLLQEDTFRLISDWYYLAIMNLAKLPENRANPQWIAKRLGIKEEKAEEALERLLRLELLKKNRNRLVRTAKPMVMQDVPSAAIRKHHNQNLHLAEQSLHRDPVDKRVFNSMTIAVNPEKLGAVKDVLLKTRKKIEDLLEDGPLSEVYTFSFQLFPLTKLQDGTEGRNV
ncbi:DUF4423 domain-containing protein [Bdellovibrio sp. SKB1291214]|uniref:DUF4423 domain-containing protein n=1 Tax=Bdellovibrio sp. SKB1291214 TaxID=1732569 RepID=UPI0022407517|nr:DUF4423 domain-containing protein [Bdellovibrio sp. SKB1291214]UYL08570.1 DUF4423 domain-containing protein [Bdellovibrio sp. SKB1291214]